MVREREPDRSDRIKKEDEQIKQEEKGFEEGKGMATFLDREEWKKKPTNEKKEAKVKPAEETVE